MIELKSTEAAEDIFPEFLKRISVEQVEMYKKAYGDEFPDESGWPIVVQEGDLSPGGAVLRLLQVESAVDIVFECINALGLGSERVFVGIVLANNEFGYSLIIPAVTLTADAIEYFESGVDPEDGLPDNEDTEE